MPAWSELSARDLSTAMNNRAVMSYIKVVPSKWDQPSPDLDQNRSEVAYQMQEFRAAIQKDPSNYAAHLNYCLINWKNGELTDRELVFQI